MNLLQAMTGLDFGDAHRTRVLSWATRSPVVDLIVQRLPQTLWVVGLAYLFGVLLAVPIGVLSAYRQHSWFDQIGAFVAMVGYSTPTFFTGVVLIVVFSVKLQWFPSVYDTNLKVTDWASFLAQVRQMALPVLVLTLYNTSQISRFVRASMLDNLHQDYVRTARAKGVKERARGAVPRSAQQSHSRRHRRRARHAHDLFRRDRHGAGVPRQRPRAIAHHSDPGRRPAARADADLHLRGADRGCST